MGWALSLLAVCCVISSLDILEEGILPYKDTKFVGSEPHSSL